MLNSIISYFKKETSPAGLGVFRICYGLILLVEVLQLYHYRHLIFDVEPYFISIDISFEYVLKAWIVCLVCLIIGFQTKKMIILNYVLTLMTFSTFRDFAYHADYAYIGLNLLLIFTPVNSAFSLDRFFSRHKGEEPKEEKVYQFHYDLIVYLGVALVYFDSIFYKYQSPMWTSGLGIWHPASLPQNTYSTYLSFLLDYKWLMLFLGYLTLIFETVFIVFMWIPKLRIPCFFIGIGLHLGIALFFPIPCFGLTCASIYLLLLPPRIWEKGYSRMSQWFFKNSLVVKFKIKSILLFIQNSFQMGTLQLNRKFNLIICLVIFVGATFIQANLVVRRNYKLVDSKIWKRTVRNSISRYYKMWPYPRVLAGLTDHGVFLHSHFDNYNHVLAVVYITRRGKEVWLPIIDEDGVCDHYLDGRLWVYWSFRVCSPNLKVDNVKKGVEKITRVWADETIGVELQNARFEIRYKEIDSVDGWEEGFYQRQVKKGWKKCGDVLWENDKCTITMEDLDKVDEVN